MIRIDATRISVVIICTRCSWAAVELDRWGAWRAGLAHQRAAHPDDVSALEAAARSVFNHRHDHDSRGTDL